MQADARARAEPRCVVVLTTEGGSSPDLTGDGEEDMRRDVEKRPVAPWTFPCLSPAAEIQNTYPAIRVSQDILRRLNN